MNNSKHLTAQPSPLQREGTAQTQTEYRVGPLLETVILSPQAYIPIPDNKIVGSFVSRLFKHIGTILNQYCRQDTPDVQYVIENYSMAPVERTRTEVKGFIFRRNVEVPFLTFEFARNKEKIGPDRSRTTVFMPGKSIAQRVYGPDNLQTPIENIVYRVSEESGNIFQAIIDIDGNKELTGMRVGPVSLERKGPNWHIIQGGRIIAIASDSSGAYGDAGGVLEQALNQINQSKI